MTRGRGSTTDIQRRIVSLILALASVWYIAFFIVVAALRASFPMQLEWIETGVLDTVARVFTHRAVYVAPTHIFVPYLYTPLYYYAGALICRVTGLGFTSLRWFSTVCTVSCFALLFEQTRALTTSRRAGLLAAGCFAGLYAASGGCYDLARVDMLYLLFTLAAIYAVWRQQPLLAGLLFACAYQSKQGAAIIAICVLAGGWRRPRQCVTGLVTFFMAAALSALWLNHVSGGWYRFYTEWLPSHQPLELRSIFYFFVRDLGRYLFPALLLIMWAARGHLRQIWYSSRGIFMLSCMLGVFLTALSGRIHSGGAANATLPLYAWAAVLFGIALHRVFVTSDPLLKTPSAGVIALAALQFLLLFTPPSHFIPSRRARRQARQFLAKLAVTRGDIYVIGGVAELAPAHKTSFANGLAVWDVIRADDSAASRALLADIRQSIEQRAYTALLAPYPLNGSETFAGEPADLSRYYRLDVPAMGTRDDLRALQTLQNPGVGPAYLYPVRP